MFESFPRDFSNSTLADACKNCIQELGEEGRSDSCCPVCNPQEVRLADVECIHARHLHPRTSEPATTQTVPPEVISRLRVSTTALNRAGTWTFSNYKYVGYLTEVNVSRGVWVSPFHRRGDRDQERLCSERPNPEATCVPSSCARCSSHFFVAPELRCPP